MLFKDVEGNDQKRNEIWEEVWTDLTPGKDNIPRGLDFVVIFFFNENEIESRYRSYDSAVLR